jgi:putative transposase
MPTVFYGHLTWTTLRRAPLITGPVAGFLHRFLPTQAARFGAEVLAIGIVRDHVHVLCYLSGNTSVPALVQALKGASARVANRDDIAPREAPLRWDPGYDFRSVSPRAVATVRNYVLGQEERHPLDRIRTESSPDGGSLDSRAG